jgi:hypothetical protein
LFDFVRGGNRDGSGEQMFALANIANEHIVVDYGEEGLALYGISSTRVPK